MNFKGILFVSIIFIILSVTTVSAADLNDSSCIYDASFESNQVLASYNDTGLNDLNPGTFADLQREINSAPSGSVLDLCRDYNGQKDCRINLNKDLTIDGHGHSIDCSSKDKSCAFYSESGNIVFKNLKITGCHNNDNDCGGAIHIEGSAQYLIDNCTFEWNYAHDYGGAIYNKVDKKLTIKNSEFFYNTAEDDDGGAIYSAGEVYIENSTLISNTALRDGGAIFCLKNVVVCCCLFNSNKVEGATSQCYGGAIRSKDTVSVENSSFRNNVAYDYGGAIYANYINVNINQDNTMPISSFFTGNQAGDDDGGAVYADSNLRAVNTEFSSNRAKVDGGAVFTCGDTIVDHCLFGNNRVEEAKSQCYGGAIRSKGVCRVNNCTFDSNMAYDYGGAIYAADLYINSNQETGRDFNTFFIKNHAKDNDGGAIYVEGSAYISNALFANNIALVDGGAIFAKNGVTVNNCWFESNKATGAASKCYGGAIRSKEVCKVNNCTFIRNFCDNHGGAVYADSMEFTDSPSYFMENRVANGHGGAVYVDKFKNSVIKHITFTDNEASSTSSDGGAVYVNCECNFKFEQCVFVSNHCGKEGGAVYLDSMSSKLNLVNNIFIGNSADSEGQSVYNCGNFYTVSGNFWGGVTPTSSNDQLIQWMPLFIPNWHEVDDNPLKLVLKLSVDYSRDKPIVIADVGFCLSSGSYYTGGELYDINLLSILPATNLKIINQERSLNRLHVEFMPMDTGKFTINAKFYDFFTQKEIEVN